MRRTTNSPLVKTMMRLLSHPFLVLAGAFLFFARTMVLPVNAFVAQPSLATSSTNPIVNGHRHLPIRHYEDSEWYSPPPEPAQAVKDEDRAKLPRRVTAKVSVIRSRSDLEHFLAEDDRLCVVKFHADWCKTCQRFNLHFAKLTADYADWEKSGDVVKRNPVRVAEVEWGANLELCKSLGVKKLPSLFFYSGGLKIFELATGPSRFAKVRKTVEKYAQMTPEDLQFEAKLEEGKRLMEEAARRERFEEVAKARALRRAATKTPKQQ